MSTRTERRYRQAIAGAGLLEGDPAALPEPEVLRAVVEAARPSPTPRPTSSSVEEWLPAIRAGLERGAGPQAIHDRLKREDPEFTATVSSVKRAVKRIRAAEGVRPEDVVIPVETGPGEVAQVDFGFAGRFFDEITGTVRKAWLFVMVLCFSRHMFARLVFDQKAATWVQLHVEAFRWFGGVPWTLVPDNLRAAVLRAAYGVGDRHELSLNRTYRELARYYRCKIDPTPVRAPEKKGKVESGVKYAVRNYLRAGGFETIGDANAGLPDWLLVTAGMRIHGTTGRPPLELFAVERDRLLPLPVVPYEPIEWKQATVHVDSHVEFGGRLYSVPWTQIGARVWVKASPTSVLIYANDERIATHERRGSGRHSTQPGHLPEHRADLAQRSVDYWFERADRLGPSVGTYVRHVMDCDSVLSKLRDIQAIVAHLERFPIHRAQAASLRADYYGNYSYQAIRRILEEALDLQPLPEAGPLHGHLSQPRFARTASELVVPNQQGGML